VVGSVVFEYISNPDHLAIDSGYTNAKHNDKTCLKEKDKNANQITCKRQDLGSESNFKTQLHRAILNYPNNNEKTHFF